ncbi:hypothetical protein, partial [Burkholderia ubonensis]|uniref:hypothetical protein n=1 Tax=Burkholderia ubonensis TaxID=101571 RepID=UPI001E618002
NRTVKRLYADDSADSRVKVGNRQAPLKPETPAHPAGVFAFPVTEMAMGAPMRENATHHPARGWWSEGL